MPRRVLMIDTLGSQENQSLEWLTFPVRLHLYRSRAQLTHDKSRSTWSLARPELLCLDTSDDVNKRWIVVLNKPAKGPNVRLLWVMLLLYCWREAWVARPSSSLYTSKRLIWSSRRDDTLWVCSRVWTAASQTTSSVLNISRRRVQRLESSIVGAMSDRSILSFEPLRLDLRFSRKLKALSAIGPPQLTSRYNLSWAPEPASSWLSLGTKPKEKGDSLHN